jgi:hypothetical protein
MATFSQQCAKSLSLARLRSITLTVHQQLPLENWMTNTLGMLSLAPLEIFQIYSTGVFVESLSTNHFWSQLVTTHGHRLKRFSVHRMLISLDAIDDICRRCTALEQFFLVIEPASLVIMLHVVLHDLADTFSPEYGWSVLCPISNIAFGPYKLPSGSPNRHNSRSLRGRCAVHHPTM